MRELEIDAFDEDAFDEYQGVAMGFAIYPGMLLYPALGLASEAGEVADKVKKLVRDDDMPMDENFNTARGVDFDRRRDIALELGDVLFYCAAVADDIGYTLSEIAEMNIAKLESRAKRGRLRGSGDYR
jgi:NTP pyrophosphatase (non-canonical NTP hydrolase)